MARKHLKRLVAPSSWGLLRKEHTFITRPLPGGTPLEHSMPLSVLLKRLGLVTTTREAKKALLHRSILLNGTACTEHKTSVGLMDTLTHGTHTFRLLLDAHGHLIPFPVPEHEAHTKPCKIIGKTMITMAKLQCHTLDGRNFLMDKNVVAVGDTVLISLPKQGVTAHHTLETGAFIYLIGGKHRGDRGVVTSIKDDAIAYKNIHGQEYTTLKTYAFVLGKGKPAITLP